MTVGLFLTRPIKKQHLLNRDYHVTCPICILSSLYIVPNHTLSHLFLVCHIPFIFSSLYLASLPLQFYASPFVFSTKFASCSFVCNVVCGLASFDHSFYNTWSPLVPFHTPCLYYVLIVSVVSLAHMKWTIIILIIMIILTVVNTTHNQLPLYATTIYTTNCYLYTVGLLSLQLPAMFVVTSVMHKLTRVTESTEPCLLVVFTDIRLVVPTDCGSKMCGRSHRACMNKHMC